MEKHSNLIKKCQKGDQRAQFELYNLYKNAMFNTSYRMMQNREAAEDMLQEAFTKAFMSINSFRFESSFGTWLKRILINKCINEIKLRKVDMVYTDNLFSMTSEEHIGSDDNEDYEHLLNVADIKNAIKQLSPNARRIFTLYLFEGFDHQEIAQILNISVSASKAQYSRAKGRIREQLISQNKGLPLSLNSRQLTKNKAV